MTIYILVLLAFLTHVGFGGSRLAVPLFAIDQGATPFIVGTIAALCAAFPVVLAMPAGRLSDRLGFRVPLVFGTSGVCIALLLPYFWPSLAMLYVTSALLGIGFMALQLGTQALAGAITTPEGRARKRLRPQLERHESDPEQRRRDIKHRE